MQLALPRSGVVEINLGVQLMSASAEQLEQDSRLILNHLVQQRNSRPFVRARNSRRRCEYKYENNVDEIDANTNFT